MGYNAYQSSTGLYGFVTCGHAVSVAGAVKDSSGVRLGLTNDKHFGGKIDAAFVIYDDPSKATSSMSFGPDITGTFSNADITVIAYASKAANINSSFGLNTYTYG